MNILLLTDSFPPMVDGVSRCVAGLAHALHAAGHTVAVLCPRVPGAAYAYPFTVHTFASFKFGYAEYRAGFPFIRGLRADILHAHSPFVSMWAARRLRRAHNIPVVFTQHTKWGLDIARAVRATPLRRLAEQIIYNNTNAADAVWAVSRGAGEYLRQNGFRGDFTVMPNATDMPPKPHRNENDKPPRLLFVGRMMRYKNIFLILDALAILRVKGFTFNMDFIGAGADLTPFKAQAAEMGLSSAITCPGQINDRDIIQDYFANADVFVFPSVYDNAPLVIREAAACKCPSLVVRGSSASEILEDGVTGFFADESAESVARGIEAALLDRAALETVARNAFDRVYAPWDAVIGRSLSRYEAVVRKAKVL
jgi:glycosyltransferase involved in cell wall biosynthesis